MRFFRMIRAIYRSDLGVILWPGTAILAIAIGMSMRESQVNSECLARGYPQSHTTFTGIGYCGRRVNNTDEVLRLP